MTQEIEPIDKKLDRYRAFWKREPIDRPILGVTLATYTPMEMFSSINLPEEGEIKPEDLDLDVFLTWYEEDYRRNLDLMGDQFWVAVPFWGVPWMEAILGCTVRISGTSIWAEPYLDGYRTLPAFDLSGENPWLVKLLEFIDRLVERFGKEIPVAPPFMRGPSDLIAALRGSQQAMLDLYEFPDAIPKLVGELSKAWVKVAKIGLESIPEFYGGYCNGNRQIWAPGTCMETQEDATGLMSPGFYGEYFVSGTQHIVSSFDYGWIHLHSANLQNLDTLLQMDEMAALEVTIDIPPSPTVEDLLPDLRRIQCYKPLILHGKLSLKEIQCLVENLSTQGLAVISRVESIEEGNELMDRLITSGFS